MPMSRSLTPAPARVPLSLQNRVWLTMLTATRHALEAAALLQHDTTTLTNRLDKAAQELHDLQKQVGTFE